MSPIWHYAGYVSLKTLPIRSKIGLNRFDFRINFWTAQKMRLWILTERETSPNKRTFTVGAQKFETSVIIPSYLIIS